MLEEEYYTELDSHINLLKKCDYMKDEKDVKKLCEKAKEILSQESNVLYLNAPITVF
jgi:serine/threonine-protein phosphatase 2A catalytic subunit